MGNFMRAVVGDRNPVDILMDLGRSNSEYRITTEIYGGDVIMEGCVSFFGRSIYLQAPGLSAAQEDTGRGRLVVL